MQLEYISPSKLVVQTQYFCKQLQFYIVCSFLCAEDEGFSRNDRRNKFYAMMRVAVSFLLKLRLKHIIDVPNYIYVFPYVYSSFILSNSYISFPIITKSLMTSQVLTREAYIFHGTSKQQSLRLFREVSIYIGSCIQICY